MAIQQDGQKQPQGDGPGRGHNTRHKASTSEPGQNKTELAPHAQDPSEEWAQGSRGLLCQGRGRRTTQELMAAGQRNKETNKLAEAIQGANPQAREMKTGQPTTLKEQHYTYGRSATATHSENMHFTKTEGTGGQEETQG